MSIHLANVVGTHGFVSVSVSLAGVELFTVTHRDSAPLVSLNAEQARALVALIHMASGAAEDMRDAERFRASAAPAPACAHARHSTWNLEGGSVVAWCPDCGARRVANSGEWIAATGGRS